MVAGADRHGLDDMLPEYLANRIIGSVLRLMGQPVVQTPEQRSRPPVSLTRPKGGLKSAEEAAKADLAFVCDPESRLSGLMTLPLGKLPHLQPWAVQRDSTDSLRH